LVENDPSGIKSDLFTPITKDVELDENGIVTNRTFFLADTEAFCDPCCVIPNLGGQSNHYFVVKPRNQWLNEFLRWVEDHHTLDQMDVLVPPEEASGEEEECPQKAKRHRNKGKKVGNIRKL
jgi:hypothetical protein